MKKKFLRSCFALLLSMVLLFGGVRWDAAAIGDVSPFGPVLPPSAVTFTVSAPQTVMIKGETMQMSYSATPSGGSITWSSSSTSVATVNSSGIVIAVAAGNVTITGRYTYNGTVYTDSVSISVYDSTGILNNTKYYIMNYSSGRLLSLEDESDSALTNVYTRARSATDLSQWRTRKLSDGYYNIQSVCSPTGKCLDVTSNNVDIYNDNSGTYLKFAIQRVESGNYQGLYLIRHKNSGLYVTQDSNYNVYVTATPTDASYWSFMAVNKRCAELFYHDYTYTKNGYNYRFNTGDQEDEFKEVFGDFGYTTVTYENDEDIVATYGGLRTRDDIFVYMGHGGPAKIEFSQKSPTGGERRITAILADSMVYTLVPTANRKYVNDFYDNDLCLSRCVIYLGCETGKSYGSNNLVDATFKKGAHFVLGVTVVSDTDQITTFIKHFMVRIDAGYSILEAINYANQQMPNILVGVEKDGTETYVEVDGLPIYYRGDARQYLNIG